LPPLSDDEMREREAEAMREHEAEEMREREAERPRSRSADRDGSVGEMAHRGKKDKERMIEAKRQEEERRRREAIERGRKGQ
jgi:hypothetical protein